MRNLIALSAVLFLTLLALLSYSANHANAQSGGLWYPSNSNLRPVSASFGLRIPSLISCTSLQTDSDGIFSCGVGPGGSGFSTTSADYWILQYDKGFFFSTTSANYWETQQTARTADDLTNNSIEDLNDVAAMTENFGDLLYWNGTNWTDIATGSLAYSWNSLTNIPAGFADGIDDTSGGASAAVSTSTNETAGHIPYWTTSSGTPARLGSVATGTLSCSSGISCTSQSIIGGASAITLNANLDDLLDVNTTGQAASNILAYNGSTWVPMSTSSYIINTEIDTVGEIEVLVGTQNILLETEIDAASELAGLLDQETGSAGGGVPVFSNNPLLTGFVSNASSTIGGGSIQTGLTVDGRATSSSLSVTGLTNCDTIDTDGNGVFTCGTDASGSGSGPTSTNPLMATYFVSTSTTATNTHSGPSQWTANANYGGNNPGEGVLGINMGSFSGSALSIHSTSAAASGDGSLLHIEMTNVSHSNELIKIESASTQGGAEDIYVVSPVPDMVFCDNTDSTNDCVEYEVDNHGTLVFNSRSNPDTSFERNVQIAAARLGGMVCLGGNFDCPFTSSKLQITATSTLDLLNVNRVGETNAPGTVFNIDSTFRIGIGSTSPFAQLSVVGSGTSPLVDFASSTGASVFKIDRTGSTTATNGINLTSGCFAIGGVCLSTGGGTSWGSITGTLSNQTDLQAALDLKLDRSATSSFPGLVNFGSSTATTSALGNLAVTGDISADQIFTTGGTSTFAGGINISPNGCIAVNGTCITPGAATAGGSDGQVQYNNGGSSLGGATNLYYDDVNNRVGIGTTTPQENLNVVGNHIVESSTGNKAYRFRTTGSNLDFDAGGADLYFTNNTAADFSGTERKYLVMGSTFDYVAPYGGWEWQDRAGGQIQHKIDGEGGVIFNEQGGDRDLRVEGDTVTHLLFTDASADRIGVGTSTPWGMFSVQGDAIGGRPIFIVSSSTNATALEVTATGAVKINGKGALYDFATTSYASSTKNSSDKFNQIAWCPSGYVAISGGFDFGTTTAGIDLGVLKSENTATSGGWAVDAIELAAVATNWDVQVSANCVRKSY